jgi:hypothetical protein
MRSLHDVIISPCHFDVVQLLQSKQRDQIIYDPYLLLGTVSGTHNQDFQDLVISSGVCRTLVVLAETMALQCHMP